MTVAAQVRMRQVRLRPEPEIRCHCSGGFNGFRAEGCWKCMNPGWFWFGNLPANGSAKT
jgi:hypothetical protein